MNAGLPGCGQGTDLHSPDLLSGQRRRPCRCFYSQHTAATPEHALATTATTLLFDITWHERSACFDNIDQLLVGIALQETPNKVFSAGGFIQG